MGYSVNYDISNAVIHRDYFEAALIRINNLFTPESIEKNLRSNWGKPTHYSWLDPGERSHTDLIEAIEEWGFSCNLLPSGDLKISNYDWEKMGDEKHMLAAIAPYLNPDCVIEVRGEDGENWRYIIRDGKLVEQKGKVVYEN